MDIRFVFHEHPSEDTWEEYAFGRLTGGKLAKTEEHLLACARCQTALAEIDDYIRVMKAGADDYPRRAKRHSAAVLLFPSGRRAVAAGIAAAGFVAAIAWLGVPDPPAATVAVQLRSLRGVMESATNRALAKHPLDLEVASTSVPAAAEYSFEIVTANGGSVWTGEAAVRGGTISAHVPKKLRAGVYWVRLYGPQSKLLAEYGLRMEPTP